MPVEFSHEDVLPDVAVGGVSARGDASPGFRGSAEGVDALRLPRRQRGNTPQSLAVLVLAEFGVSPRVWFPSVALVDLVESLGSTTTGARAVVHRLARRGVLEGRKQGRRTAYRVGDAAAVALARGGQALATFADAAESWDGAWSLLAFSGPTDDAARRALHGRLRWRGYAPLYDGLWVAPRCPDDLVTRVLEPAGVTAVTLFRAEQLDTGAAPTRDPLAVWDTEVVREHYAAFLDRWAPEVSRVRRGRLGSVEAFRARVEVEDDYRAFVVLDPRLPLRVMPRGWPRTRARDTFVTVYDGLAGPALDHVRGAVARAAGEESAAEIRAHPVDRLARGVLSDAGGGPRRAP